jgi:hypothetical protein
MAGIVALRVVLFLIGDPPTLPPLDPSALRAELPVSLDPESPGLSVWVRGEYWYAIPSGQLVITRGSRPGTGDLIRVGQELDLDPSGVPSGELGATLGDHRLRLSYLDLHFDGEEVLDQSLVFHGQTYPAGDHVRSRIDLPRLSINYDYDVWDTRWTKLRLGVVGHVYWISARLSGTTLDEKRAYSRGTGALAAAIDVPLGTALASIDGSLGYSDSDHDFFGGIRLLVSAKIWGPIGIDAGYRWERMDASAETNRVALTIHGPFVGLIVRF